jgi:hypothetical protein
MVGSLHNHESPREVRPNSFAASVAPAKKKSRAKRFRPYNCGTWSGRFAHYTWVTVRSPHRDRSLCGERLFLAACPTGTSRRREASHRTLTPRAHD